MRATTDNDRETGGGNDNATPWRAARRAVAVTALTALVVSFIVAGVDATRLIALRSDPLLLLPWVLIYFTAGAALHIFLVGSPTGLPGRLCRRRWTGLALAAVAIAGYAGAAAGLVWAVLPQGTALWSLIIMGTAGFAAAVCGRETWPRGMALLPVTTVALPGGVELASVILEMTSVLLGTGTVIGANAGTPVSPNPNLASLKLGMMTAAAIIVFMWAAGQWGPAIRERLRPSGYYYAA